MMLIPASCVSINGRGVLIRGPSGSGKSDLALRLIDNGALLVADDQVSLTAGQGQLLASCPLPTRGLIESRHVGLMMAPMVNSAPVALVVDPGMSGLLERLPEPESILLSGFEIPHLTLAYLEASTAAKIRLFLNQGGPPP